MARDDTRRTFFATTRWSLVCDAARGGGQEASDALGQLFSTYWRPLYRYVRRRGRSEADAEDLVQGFFVQLMQHGGLGELDPAKGRFRSYLLAALDHWMINDWKRATRLRRGGGVPVLSFDWPSAERNLVIEAADERSPDRLFDREWALALLDKVLGDLEKAYMAEGQGAWFAVLKPCLTSDAQAIPYARMAEQLGGSDGALRVAVHRLRKRYRAMLTGEIAHTLVSPEMVEEEMRALFAALRDDG